MLMVGEGKDCGMPPQNRLGRALHQHRGADYARKLLLRIARNWLTPPRHLTRRCRLFRDLPRVSGDADHERQRQEGVIFVPLVHNAADFGAANNSTLRITEMFIEKSNVERVFAEEQQRLLARRGLGDNWIREKLLEFVR